MKVVQCFVVFGLSISFLTKTRMRGKESGSNAMEKPWWFLNGCRVVLNRNQFSGLFCDVTLKNCMLFCGLQFVNNVQF